MKAIVKLFILLLVLVNITKAQVILPMGLGQKNSLNISCSDGDKMWVVSNENELFAVNKWDGNFWIRYNDIPTVLLNTISTIPQSIEAKALYHYNNTLYLALSNKNNDKLLLLKNTGRKWEAITTTDTKASKKLTFLNTNNGLLLCGKISVAGQLITILKVGQNDCSIFAGLPANYGASDYYSNFEYKDNIIWAIGSFTSPINLDNRYFAKFENNAWSIVSNAPFVNGNIAIVKFQNNLVMVGVDFDLQNSFSIQKTDTTWEEMSNGLTSWKINSISDLRQIGKNIWAAGQFTNTITNNLASLAFWNGSTWTVPSFDYIGNDITLNGKNQVFISGAFVNYQGLLLHHTGKLDFGNAIVAGKVFNDLNQNCTQEFGESSAPGVIVKLTPENIFIMTDYNGRYYFPTDSNSKIQHLVELQLPKYREATCGSIKPAIITSQLTIANIDFGLRPNGTHIDASTQVNDFTGWRARQGFDEHYKICVDNRGTQKIESGKLVFKTDERLTNWVFSDQPIRFQNNTAEWNIKPLLANERYCLNAKTTIPVDIALQSEILFDAKIVIGDLQDEDMTNNSCVLKQKIVAAIDPNDKKTQQNYFIEPTTKVIDYKIRFQNTGIDTAYNILITDTIDSNLSIGYQGTQEEVSHLKNFNSVMTYWKQPNGKYQYKLSWMFNNILLADSNTNEEASHGYINYKLNLAGTLPIGTEITNRAFINFDFQEAIITNTAKNIVSLPNNVKTALPLGQLSIYPNPANDYITIANPLKSSINITVINSLGQIVLSKTVAAESKLTVSTMSMAKGLYMIQAQGYATKKITVN